MESQRAFIIYGWGGGDLEGDGKNVATYSHVGAGGGGDFPTVS